MKHEPVLATVRRAFGSVRGAGSMRIPENMEDVFERGASEMSDHPVILPDVLSRWGA